MQDGKELILTTHGGSKWNSLTKIRLGLTLSSGLMRVGSVENVFVTRQELPILAIYGLAHRLIEKTVNEETGSLTRKSMKINEKLPYARKDLKKLGFFFSGLGLMGSLYRAGNRFVLLKTDGTVWSVDL